MKMDTNPETEIKYPRIERMTSDEMEEFFINAVRKATEFDLQPARFLFWLDNKKGEMAFMNEAAKTDPKVDFKNKSIKKKASEYANQLYESAEELKLDDELKLEKRLEKIDGSEKGLDNLIFLFEDVHKARDKHGMKKAEAAYGRTLYKAIYKSLGEIVEAGNIDYLHDLIDASVQDGVSEYVLDVINQSKAIEILISQLAEQGASKSMIETVLEEIEKKIALGIRAKKAFLKEELLFDGIEKFSEEISKDEANDFYATYIDPAENKYFSPVRKMIEEIETDFKENKIQDYNAALDSYENYLNQVSLVYRGITEKSVLLQDAEKAKQRRDELFEKIFDYMDILNQEQEKEFIEKQWKPLLEKYYESAAKLLNEMENNYDYAAINDYRLAMYNLRQFLIGLENIVIKVIEPYKKEIESQKKLEDLHKRIKTVIDFELSSGEVYNEGDAVPVELSPNEKVDLKCISIKEEDQQKGAISITYGFQIVDYSEDFKNQAIGTKFEVFYMESANEYRDYLGKQWEGLLKKSRSVLGELSDSVAAQKVAHMTEVYFILQQEKKMTEIRRKGNVFFEMLHSLNNFLNDFTFLQEGAVDENDVTEEVEIIDTSGKEETEKDINTVARRLNEFGLQYGGAKWLNYRLYEQILPLEFARLQSDFDSARVNAEIMIAGIEMIINEDDPYALAEDAARMQKDFDVLVENKNKAINNDVINGFQTECEWDKNDEKLLGELLVFQPKQAKIKDYQGVLLKRFAMIRMMEEYEPPELRLSDIDADVAAIGSGDVDF